MSGHVKIISLVFYLSLFQGTISIQKGSTSSPEAWLFPGRETRGISIIYSKTNDWSDLDQQLEANGFLTVGKLCLKGVFGLYRKPNYEAKAGNDVLIASGNVKCTMMTSSTKSAQLVASAGSMMGPSITFFEKPFFGSAAFPTSINVGSNFFKKLTDVQSLIIIGNTPFEIWRSNGEKLCLQPDFDPTERSPICLVKDLSALLDSDDDNITSVPMIVRASQGCRKVKEDNIHRIQDCMYWGSSGATSSSNQRRFVVFEEEVSKTVGTDANGFRTLASEPTEVADTKLCGNDTKVNQTLELYKILLTKDFDNDLLVGLEIIGHHSWKLDLFDWIFTIVKTLIPEEIMSGTFFNKLREVFIYKLIPIWKLLEPEPLDEPDTLIVNRYYRLLMKQIEMCQMALASEAGPIKSAFEALWNQTTKEEDFNDQLISLHFKRVEQLDIVTELVWLAGHMVGYACHKMHLETFDFWSNYFYVWYHMYMAPLGIEWTNPVPGLSFFFGGVNLQVEYNKLAAFTTVLRSKVKNLPPLLRPDVVLDYYYHKSSTDKNKKKWLINPCTESEDACPLVIVK